MKKIKIVGAIILLLSIILAIISQYLIEQNKINTDLLKSINQQKSFTQEISKNIFYIYRSKNKDMKQLDLLTKKFIENMNQRDNKLYEMESNLIKKQKDKIIHLWNSLYSDVRKFKNQNKNTTIYSNLILEKTVNNIYKTNLILILEFDKLILEHQKQFHVDLHFYKTLQYVLFLLLTMLLVYLFTQVKDIMIFIQKFRKNTKSVIKNSSISELKPMEVKNNNQDIQDATDNFNFLLKKVNDSITYSYQSLEHTSNSLVKVEDNIEEFLTILNKMDENNSIDIDMAKKEDAVIQSLEELINLNEKLNNLKEDLEELVKNKN